MTLVAKYRKHIPLAIGVSLVLIAYPAVHPVIGAFGFIMSLMVSVMSSVLLSMASDASFATQQSESDDTETTDFEPLRADELSNGREYESVDEVKEAYVNGEIDEIEFGRVLEEQLDEEIEIDADGRLKRVPENNDPDTRTQARTVISEQLRPSKSRVADTSDEDPRDK